MVTELFCFWTFFNKKLFSRFFNYPGQPGLSSVPSVLPNMMPTTSSPNSAMMPQISRPCISNYVDFPDQHLQNGNSPIVQLQNFGRHFENT